MKHETLLSKVLPYLVNTEIDKNYPVGNFGLRILAMGAINPVFAILEKYFRRMVSKNLEDASKTFQYNDSEISEIDAYFI